MFTKRSQLFLFCVSAFCVSAFPQSAFATVRYAKSGGLPTGFCLTWATACNLPTAITTADAATNDEIWVQAGTYAPFALKTGIRVYGGFAGMETAASQSNPVTNVTIIDGGGAAECVTGNGELTGTILRGFTLRNGRDTGGEGGGMFLYNSSAIFVQCIFEENSATYLGGAVAIHGGSPQFFNCIFRKNGTAATNPRDTAGGGAVFVDSGGPLFGNCLFHDNKSGQGGAVLVREASVTFANCTMAANQSYYVPGGAIADPNSGVTIKNCILWDNTRMLDSDGEGGNPPVEVADQIANGLYGNTIAIYSNVEGGWAIGSNNMNTDPLFTNPGINDYTLGQGSPCQNTGFNDHLPADSGDLDWDGVTTELLPKDLNMNPRQRHPVGNPVVDMGAYERQTADE